MYGMKLESFMQKRIYQSFLKIVIKIFWVILIVLREQ